MYCRKCGKYIYNSDAMYCEDCEEMDSFFGESKNAEETPSYTYQRPSYNPAPTRVEPVYSAPKGNRKEGFGRALASTILSTISFVLAAAAYVYVLDTSMIGTAVILFILALASAIPSLVMGIKSINCFKAACREGRVKPVATLVLGIVGLSMSAFSLLYIWLAMTCAYILI